MSQTKDNIVTYGDMSPGNVEGDYIVQNITKSKETKKQWRSLSEVAFPIYESTEKNFSALIEFLAFSMLKAFKGRGYIKFVGLLHKINVDNKFEAFTILNNNPDFSGKAKEILISSLQEQNKDELNNMGKALKDYAIKYDFANITTGESITFIFDENLKSMFIGKSDIRTTKLSNYPDKCTTTSEALIFIGNVFCHPLVNLGDNMFKFVKNNYPLEKLLLELMDNKKINLHNIRINNYDYEEWDYINPVADEEMNT
jgi:hypothetical protein